jgi:hypothetical protein
VVLIDMQITGSFDSNVDAAMPCNLLQHVVEEADAGADCAMPVTVEVDINGNSVSFVFLETDALRGRPVRKRLIAAVAGAERSFFVLPVTYVNSLQPRFLANLYLSGGTDYE